MAPRRIPAAATRNICGGVSDMTLHRWLHNKELNFPRPIYIAKRRYWDEEEILSWLEARKVQGAS